MRRGKEEGDKIWNMTRDSKAKGHLRGHKETVEASYNIYTFMYVYYIYVYNIYIYVKAI